MTKQELIERYNYDEGTITIQDKEIYFTVLQNETLKVLVDNYGKWVKTEDICQAIYQDIDEYLKNALSTHISRIRKKLKGAVEIKNRFGYGYKLIVKE